MDASIPTSAPMALEQRIDAHCDSVGNSVRARMTRLEEFSEARLERIMFEAWQVSLHNPPILLAAAEATRPLIDQGAYAELMRNYREEETHSELYRRGLAEIGTDVAQRTSWPPSDRLFALVNQLIAAGPSTTIGSMYASEAVALFESELLLAVAREVIRRRAAQTRGKRLVAFHEMHLGGVEQGHKNGLAPFLKASTEAANNQLDLEKVEQAALATIDAIGVWWDHLLAPDAPVKEGFPTPDSEASPAGAQSQA